VYVLWLKPGESIPAAVELLGSNAAAIGLGQIFSCPWLWLNYNVGGEISVVGDDQHPLYANLTTAQLQAIGEGPFREKRKAYGVDPKNPVDVLRNFEKFLIDRKGSVVARFSPDVAHDNPLLLAAIDAELTGRGHLRPGSRPLTDIHGHSGASPLRERMHPTCGRSAGRDVDLGDVNGVFSQQMASDIHPHRTIGVCISNPIW